MNLTTIPASLEPPPLPGAAQPTPSAAPAPTASVEDVFGTLLALAAAPAPSAATPTPGLPEPDDGSGSEGVDWTLPFLAPAPAQVPTPLDLELPADDEASAAALTRVAAAARLGDGSPTLPATANAGIDAATAPTAAARAELPQVPQPAVRTVTTPVHDTRWPAHVGHELRLLVEHGVQSATLRLNPEHLGPVDVRIEIAQDKASVVFGASQAETRAALQEALPRLRELFAAGGLSLAEAGVRDERAHARPDGRRHGWDEGSASPHERTEATSGPSLRVGLVDAYA